MFSLLKDHKGKVNVNGIDFDSILEAKEYFKDYVGGIRIHIMPNNTYNDMQYTPNISNEEHVYNSSHTNGNFVHCNGEYPTLLKGHFYSIKVKKYLTEEYDPSCFVGKILSEKNPNGHMPFVSMEGEVLIETPKMVKMSLDANLYDDSVVTCIRCGRQLTNPISKVLHIGPECGALEHMELISSGYTIEDAKKDLQNKLLKTSHWEGWIFKSGIKEYKEIIKEKN